MQIGRVGMVPRLYITPSGGRCFFLGTLNHQTNLTSQKRKLREVDTQIRNLKSFVNDLSGLKFPSQQKIESEREIL